MGGLVIILALFTFIAVFNLLAQTHGVDSRPDFDDPRAPVRGLYS